MRFVAIALTVGLAVGCSGNDGPRRYQVSGQITFRGQPVPVGVMSFEPNTAEGNHGPGGSGTIKDGNYVTTPGFGVVGGPYIIRITGFDGKPIPGGDMIEGAQLFPETEIAVNLPQKDMTYDIEIPDRRK
jgi:hypothetical protein